MKESEEVMSQIPDAELEAHISELSQELDKEAESPNFSTVFSYLELFMCLQEKRIRDLSKGATNRG